MLDDPAGDTDAVVEAAVLQRAIDLAEERDKRLAVMIGRVMAGQPLT